MKREILERTEFDLGTLPESVPTKENDEPLVALVASDRLAMRPVWVEHPKSIEGKLYNDYIKMHPNYDGIYLRKTVAAMLESAALKLPRAWQLVVVAGHRPLQVQQALYDRVFNQFTAKYPDLSPDEIGTMTRLYVSDPTRKPSPHCCGSAVDIDAIDVETGRSIDFGTIINTSSKRSHIHDPHISEQARANRMLLLEAMIEAGFSSLHSEWWHFSYGDQNWAAFYELPSAIYGVKEV